MLDCRFKISAHCCKELKKKPLKDLPYRQFVGTMADESNLRRSSWLMNGCNAFDSKDGTSKPLSVWTEQDILLFIKLFEIPISPVYGKVVEYDPRQLPGQQSLFEELGMLETCKLCTTGVERSGCMYCLYGMHREKGETRLQKLKKTHPKIYNYALGGGAFDTDGLWKPTKDGLGLAFVCDEVNRVMGKTIYRY